jgi:hypothetical protein
MRMSANSHLTHRSKKKAIRSSARASSLSGIVRPSALAVIAELAKKALDGPRSSISGLDDHRVRRLPRRRSLCLRMYFLEQFGSLRLQVDDERTQSGEVARQDALDALPVRTMTADDEGPAIAIMVLAFATDPVTRWAWPHPHQYMAAMPSYVRAFGGGAFAHGTAYCTNEYTGAALWLPPGVHPDEDRLGELMASTYSPAVPSSHRVISRSV